MVWSNKELEWIENNNELVNSGDPDKIVIKIWDDLGFSYHKLILSIIFLLKLPIRLDKDKFTKNWQLRADFKYSSEVLVLQDFFILDRDQVKLELKRKVLPDLGLSTEIIDYIMDNLNNR